MRQNPSPSSLARKTWVEWNRTLVNRWKNNVALYSPSNVRLLLWADATLFSSYEAVLPPAPPAWSASKESLLSAGRSTTSPAPPGDDGGDQYWSSPWSGFDDELPPNQEARPATPPALTPLPPPESAPGPSSLPLPTQPPSDPTLALLMNMMSTFQSEMKSLRSDLLGSVSSMVAEAVAAQLPQVLLILFVQAFLNFVTSFCYTALKPHGPVSFVTLSCCTKNFGVSLFLSGPTQPGTPCDASQSEPAHGQGTCRGSPTGIVWSFCSSTLRSHVLLLYAYILVL